MSADALRQALTADVLRCQGCGGRGWHSVSDHAPGCDGECQACPVELQIECDCIGAIREQVIAALSRPAPEPGDPDPHCRDCRGTGEASNAQFRCACRWRTGSFPAPEPDPTARLWQSRHDRLCRSIENMAVFYEAKGHIVSTGNDVADTLRAVLRAALTQEETVPLPTPPTGAER